MTFCVGPYDTFVVKIFATHFQVMCIPDPEFSDRRANFPMVEVCTEVLEALQTGIEHILHDLNYINTRHHFTFPCQARGCTGGHPAKLNWCRGSPCNLYCSSTRKRFQLPTNVHFWEPALKGINKQKFEASAQSTGRLTEGDLTSIFCQLSKHASKWRKIGMFLGFYDGELSNIEACPHLMHCAPETWLHTMLTKWLQWAPGDSRGSTAFATLDGLKAALSKAGLGVAAHDLEI